MQQATEKDPEAERDGFVLRPPPSLKFPKSDAKRRVERVVAEALHDKSYEASAVPQWTEEVAACVRAELADLKLPRYKFVVQVSIGEQRGQGLSINSGVFWDSDTDATVGLLYSRDTFFCQVTIYAVYSY
ncbi:hypothetical protein QR680_017279 [Steinernema hermaphroditum]|uniref:Tctex1 domain-containing protein 2 n=1 Tax=Steinernema hermaphroditum TaxID=289476 RepID=A0AA39HF57_9BILA|nr:hypothetical protein QR680_017279 [Steinernema hermaphroditum]